MSEKTWLLAEVSIAAGSVGLHESCRLLVRPSLGGKFRPMWQHFSVLTRALGSWEDQHLPFLIGILHPQNGAPTFPPFFTAWTKTHGASMWMNTEPLWCPRCSVPMRWRYSASTQHTHPRRLTSPEGQILRSTSGSRGPSLLSGVFINSGESAAPEAWDFAVTWIRVVDWFGRGAHGQCVQWTRKPRLECDGRCQERSVPVLGHCSRDGGRTLRSVHDQPVEELSQPEA